jgi:Ca2+-binding RTX toxin-like protein
MYAALRDLTSIRKSDLRADVDYPSLLTMFARQADFSVALIQDIRTPENTAKKQTPSLHLIEDPLLHKENSGSHHDLAKMNRTEKEPNDGAGEDFIFGADGKDTLFDFGDNSLSSGLFRGSDGNDYIEGSKENDRIHGGSGNDVLKGGAGNDYISGEEGHDRILGGSGNDVLKGGAGNDYIAGNEGNDRIFGGIGDDMIYGRGGIDELFGNLGDDWITGGAGNDCIIGGDGDDNLSGGEGNDWIVGDEGDDTLFGDEGNDTLSGSAGNNWLLGGKGNDTIAGGFGNDKLSGQSGNDILLGGPGADDFIGSFKYKNDTDTILDYSRDQGDKLVFVRNPEYLDETFQSEDLFDISYVGRQGAFNMAEITYKPTGEIIWKLHTTESINQIEIQEAGSDIMFDLIF